MSRKYLIRITELERLLSEQAEALRQRDLQLSLVEETEAFLRSALARAEEKIEEEEREIEYLRAQIEKLRRMLFGTRSEKLQREVEQAEAQLKQREQESDRYSGREDDPQVPRQLRQSRHRRPLPAHLPREIHRLEPEESCCPECGSELDYLGEGDGGLPALCTGTCRRKDRRGGAGNRISEGPDRKTAPDAVRYPF